jgi:hypothetical protein
VLPKRKPGVSKGAPINSYAFQGGPIAPAYQSAPFIDTRERKVAKAGIAEKWLIALPYLPFSIGLIGGLILLLLMPKEETKVRFHAAQGLAAHIGILIVTTILGIVSNVTDMAGVGQFHLSTCHYDNAGRFYDQSLEGEASAYRSDRGSYELAGR